MVGPGEEEACKEILWCFYRHKEWIPNTVIERFLEEANNYIAGIKPELKELLADWENGGMFVKGKRDTRKVSEEYDDVASGFASAINSAYDAAIERELDAEEGLGDGMTAEDIRAILNGTYEKGSAEDGVDRSLLVYTGINVLAMAASAVLEGKMKQVPPTEDERRYPEFIMTVADTGNSYVFVLMKTPAQVKLNIYSEPDPLAAGGAQIHQQDAGTGRTARSEQ